MPQSGLFTEWTLRFLDFRRTVCYSYNMTNLKTPLHHLSVSEISNLTAEASRLLKLLLPVYMRYLHEAQGDETIPAELVYEDMVVRETIALLGEEPRPALNQQFPNELGMFVEWTNIETQNLGLA